MNDPISACVHSDVCCGVCCGVCDPCIGGCLYGITFGPRTFLAPILPRVPAGLQWPRDHGTPPMRWCLTHLRWEPFDEQL